MLNSNAERSFILAALREGKRLDGRKVDERRDICIHLGREWGTAEVSLGDTRVLASTSCSVGEPRSVRPNEGILKTHIEPLSKRSMTTEALVELNRVIERVLKESKCVDMESLCISSEEKVWIISLEMTLLSDAGNAADCASIAGLAALCHFKRPDVTLKGDKIRIHPFYGRDPVPLAIHHHPVLSTFALYGRVSLLDPSREEEAVMDGKVVPGMNPYREICALHLAGQKLVDKALVLQLASKAAEEAKNIVNQLKNILLRDAQSRKAKEDPCLANALREEASLLTHAKKDHESLDVRKWASSKEPKALSEGLPATIENISEGVLELIPNDSGAQDNNMETDDEEEEVAVVKGIDLEAGKTIVDAPA
uniref:Exosome complex component RRP45 n=1 Tax=Caligus clemensi TaxID=344056 RepID=C1C167_CALCM|nr:Exosome complex exonuclease RRP45 [Caligus clemensi]